MEGRVFIPLDHYLFLTRISDEDDGTGAARREGIQSCYQICCSSGSPPLGNVFAGKTGRCTSGSSSGSPTLFCASFQLLGMLLLVAHSIPPAWEESSHLV